MRKIVIPQWRKIKMVMAAVLSVVAGMLVVVNDYVKSYGEAFLFLLLVVVFADYVRISWREGKSVGKFYELENVEEIK